MVEVLFEIEPVTKGGKYFHKFGYTARFAIEDGEYIYRFGGLDPLLVEPSRVEEFMEGLQTASIWGVRA